MSRGFTLTEVIVALVVVQVSLMGAMGMMVLAAQALSEAEEVGRVLSAVEATADSLATTAGPAADRRRMAWGEISWVVSLNGRIDIRAVRESGDTLDLRGQVR